MLTFISRIVTYGKKILNDEFDGSEGFALAGGIKDASYVIPEPST